MFQSYLTCEDTIRQSLLHHLLRQETRDNDTAISCDDLIDLFDGL